MEMALLTVTVVSLILATGLAVVAWKVMRDAQRFGAARVEALVALARSNEFAATLSALPADSGKRATSLPLDMDMGDTTFFAATAPTRSQPRLAFALSAAAVIVVLAPTLTYFTPAGTRLLSSVLSVTSAGTSVSAPPLELRTLSNSFDDAGNFVVSGRLFDPANGGTREEVVAVVTLFDEAGAPVASGRATIATATLHPGEESAFEVHVATSATITRYRVGFRGPNGETLTHLDRRTVPTGATPQR